MTASSLFRVLAATALAVSVTLPAGAQSIVGKDKSGPVPNPVALDTTGMFQAKFASVGDDMFIGGQPTEKALRELRAKGVTIAVALFVLAGSVWPATKLGSEFMPSLNEGTIMYMPTTLPGLSITKSAERQRTVGESPDDSPGDAQSSGGQPAIWWFETIDAAINPINTAITTRHPSIVANDFAGQQVARSRQQSR